MDIKSASQTAAAGPSETPSHEMSFRPASRSALTTMWPRSTGALPDDILQKAASRLALMCVFYVVTFTLAYVTVGVFDITRLFPPGGYPIGVIAGALSCVLAGAVFWISRSGRFPPETVLQVGLLFEIAGALVISLAENTEPRPTSHAPLGISWVTFWITMFPLLVPCQPRRAVVYTLWAAAMGPVGYFMTVWINGNPMLPAGYLIQFFLGNLIAAIWATVAARAVFELGSNLSEARRLGSYNLVELLGAGGMGEVWRATHRRLIRPAAVKLIRPRGMDPTEIRTMRRRFEREAQATAVLESQHTVVLYDFGVTDEGVFYYAMELLGGMDFESMVRKFGPMPPERVVHMLRQVCHSLQDAHEHGLVHRDIKPANIVACKKGGDLDFVKVLDFGLVKSTKFAPGESKLTADDSASGTPAYMAPEMVMGEGDVDRRADLYSLGCVAYYLLTGELVFSADSAMRLLFKHVHDPPPRPSSLCEEPLPAALEEIIMACLAKDPADRPQSAREVANSLAAVPLEADWTEARMSRWWQLHVPDLSDTGRWDAPASLQRARDAQSA